MTKMIATVGVLLALGAFWIDLWSAGWMIPYYLPLYLCALLASIVLFAKRARGLGALVLCVTVLTFVGSRYLTSKFWGDVNAGKVFRSVDSPTFEDQSANGQTYGGTGTAGQ